MMEQMGLPQPIQVLPYEQRYKESLFGMDQRPMILMKKHIRDYVILENK